MSEYHRQAGDYTQEAVRQLKASPEYKAHTQRCLRYIYHVIKRLLYLQNCWVTVNIIIAYTRMQCAIVISTFCVCLRLFTLSILKNDRPIATCIHKK